MCLVKVRQEEEVVVPYRRVVRRDPSPRRRSHQSIRRISRTEVIHESPRPSASYIAVPAPKPLAIPAPQPAPIFYEQPAPAPPPIHHHHQPHHQEQRAAHYVEVSPRSSYSSHSPSRASDYVIHEQREYRRQQRRDYSPEDRSPRYEHFRYVEGPESERYERRRSRSRVRERSLSRGPADYGERVTRERVSVHVGDGRRSRDYREYR
ncbi:hypothetical protein DM02DRAFT_617524 [Periconia macrospinosa]|uniref:Uncharacterized protein n=1 Tax=Periconia macrospinosa TaxID=97972 RepID=A0A2V1DEI1_9PLEO|nr:hypothetical protein DM02DRAFT_617524 [Periconia macrospinosa]